jgi:hypothetical protein
MVNFAERKADGRNIDIGGIVIILKAKAKTLGHIQIGRTKSSSYIACERLERPISIYITIGFYKEEPSHLHKTAVQDTLYLEYY